MSQNMIDKVSKEIEKTGFPLELRVAEFLNAKGYLVAHSIFYVDEDESKSREVDLRVLKNYEIKIKNRVLWVRFCFLIECKKCQNKPWVFLSSNKTPFDIDYNKVPFLPNRNFLGKVDFDRIKVHHPFAKYKKVARSYFEAFKNNERSENIFKALTTVVKATLFTMKKGFVYDKTSICFYYPLIILDGRLFQGTLSNGKIEVEEVNSVLVSFLYESSTLKEGKFSIPVLKETEIYDFFCNLDKTLNIIGNIAQSDIEDTYPGISFS